MTRVKRVVEAAQLGVLIKETQTLLHQRMDEVLRPIGLTVPQYAVLSALREQPGLTGSELARRAFVSRQSMNVVLQGLERRGLIVRSDEPGARRERAASATAAASRLLDVADDGVAVVIDVMTAHLGGGQLAQVCHALTACRDALEDMR